MISLLPRLPLRDRAEAGRLLARELLRSRPASEAAQALPLVLALPRGGVAVARPIADVLQAPLDLLLVRKVGAPGQPELAYAALVDGDPPVLQINEALAADWPVAADWLAAAVARERRELEARRQRYCSGRARVPVRGREVVVVDDGMATGTTMAAALQALRRDGAARLVLAVPVAPRSALQRLGALADAVHCLATPSPFGAVGEHYADFHQLDDAEVLHGLHPRP